MVHIMIYTLVLNYWAPWVVVFLRSLGLLQTCATHKPAVYGPDGVRYQDPPSSLHWGSSYDSLQWLQRPEWTVVGGSRDVVQSTGRLCPLRLEKQVLSRKPFQMPMAGCTPRVSLREGEVLFLFTLFDKIVASDVGSPPPGFGV